MSKSPSLRIAAALGLLLTIGSVTAQAQPGGVEVRNEAFVSVETTDVGGKTTTKLVPAGKVVPGNEVLYVVTVKNLGKQPVDKLSVDNPVPQHMSYVPESAAGERALALVSVDGGKTYGDLAVLRIAGADGKLRPAQAGDVTHLRWTLGYALQAGEQGKVSFKARLE